MKYKYEALNVNGKKKKGILVADNEAGAISQLREMGFVPTELVGQKLRMGADGSEAKNLLQMEIGSSDIHKKKISRKKLIALFSQMAIMLKAGVNFSIVLEVLCENEKVPYMRRILKEIHADMLAGLPVSQSMEKFAAFDNIITNIVKSGEADGHLERSFSQISLLIEKQHNLISKVKSASIYPCILLVMVIAVMIILNSFVLPTFVDMFRSTGQAMPPLTEVVMSISENLTKYWYLIIIAVIVVVGVNIALYKCNPRFNLWVDKTILKLPVVGILVCNSQTARFARILSTLLESGQDFLGAMSISQSVLSNNYMSSALILAADEIRMGNPVSVSLAKLTFFEPVLISMVRAGEESGSMSETLKKMAEMYEEQTDENTKRITLLMEPVMTVAIAGIVGFVVISLVLPMFNMFNLVGNI